jgi:hypothetical protein
MRKKAAVSHHMQNGELFLTHLSLGPLLNPKTKTKKEKITVQHNETKQIVKIHVFCMRSENGKMKTK